MSQEERKEELKETNESEKKKEGRVVVSITPLSEGQKCKGGTLLKDPVVEAYYCVRVKEKENSDRVLNSGAPYVAFSFYLQRQQKGSYQYTYAFKEKLKDKVRIWFVKAYSENEFEVSYKELPEKEVDGVLQSFFMGGAYNLEEGSIKDLKKSYGVLPKKLVILAVVLFFVALITAVFIYYQKSKPKPQPSVSYRPKKVKLTDREKELLGVYFTEKFFENLKGLSSDPRYYRLSAITVSKPRISSRSGRFSYSLEWRYLFPVDGGSLTTCGKYPCWKKVERKSLKVSSREIKRVKRELFKLQKRNWAPTVDCLKELDSFGFFPKRILRNGKAEFFYKGAQNPAEVLEFLYYISKKCPVSLTASKFTDKQTTVQLILEELEK